MAAQQASFWPSLTAAFSRRRAKRAGAAGAWLAPVIHRPWALVEVVVAMSLIIGACWVIRPTDALLLSFDFPWIWVPATLFALRYGALIGMAAGLVIAAAWFFFYPLAPGMTFPIMKFAGGFAELIVAGHFADIWHDRQQRFRVENEYLRQRLTALTNNHYLLRLSHDRLEREVFYETSTLQDSLSDLRRLCSSADEEAKFPGAQSLLEYVAEACQISNASIHAVGPEGVSEMPLASVGARVALDTANPLIQECIQTRELSHIGNDSALQSTYLACVPVMSPTSHVIAVMVIRDMVFEGLNRSNLQFLLTLFAYYGGILEDRLTVAEIQSMHSECPAEFASELGRLGHLARHGQLPSCLIGINVLDKASGAELEQRIHRAEMEGASVWRRELPDGLSVVLLYPLFGNLNHLEAEWEDALGVIGAQYRLCLIEPDLTDRGLSNVLFGLGSDGKNHHHPIGRDIGSQPNFGSDWRHPDLERS